jgi:hypothetical protein
MSPSRHTRGTSVPRVLLGLGGPPAGGAQVDCCAVEETPRYPGQSDRGRPPSLSAAGSLCYDFLAGRSASLRPKNDIRTDREIVQFEHRNFGTYAKIDAMRGIGCYFLWRRFEAANSSNRLATL